MAYRLQLNESLSDGVRRIGLEQIERAVAELQAADRATAVHDTRKAMKRIRAMLRLVRPALGRAVFRAENERYRAVAELLSGTRDAQVALETLAKLEPTAANETRKHIAAVRDAFAARAHETLPAGENVADALSRLGEAAEAMRGLDLGGADYAAGWDGLERVYRAGREAMDRASGQYGDEAIHEWRKTVQRHWRHMSLVSQAWPEALHARVVLARDLSQVLGDDHDLAVLVDKIEGLAGARTRAAVAKAACAEQERLRARARLLGRRLYAAKPSDLRRQMALYWATACDEATAMSRPVEPVPDEIKPNGKDRPRRPRRAADRSPLARER